MRKKGITAKFVKWSDTSSYRHFARQDAFLDDREFVAAKAVITQTGDTVSSGAFVIVRMEAVRPFTVVGILSNRLQQEYLCAQIREIVTPAAPAAADDIDVLIAVQRFNFGSVKHPVFDMPTISRQDQFAVLRPNAIISSINVQHDCPRGRCTITRPQNLYQEREVTGQQRMLVAHSDDEHYILNMQSLHNYQSLALLVPNRLRQSSYCVPDEVQLRLQAAASIRSKLKEKVEAKEDLFAATVSERVEGNGVDADATECTSTELLQSLENDNELIDVLQAFLQRSIDDDPADADLNTDLPIPSASLAPFIPLLEPRTVAKAKTQSKKKSLPEKL